MPEGPYAELRQSVLILRDHLALSRTVLANERTLLAYIRTALSLSVTGAFLVKFFETPSVLYTGWAFIPLGGAVLVFGVARYRKMQVMLRRALDKTPPVAARLED